MRRLKQRWIAAALGMSVWMTACAGAASETATQEGAVDEVAYAEGVDEASKTLDQKIRSYMKENKCTYNEAFRAVK